MLRTRLTLVLDVSCCTATNWDVETLLCHVASEIGKRKLQHAAELPSDIAAVTWDIPGQAEMTSRLSVETFATAE